MLQSIDRGVLFVIRRFQEFVSGITVCYKYLQRIKNFQMTELGLKGIHVSCLFNLHNCPEGLTATQLCSLCCEDKATISRTVADLREKGYIEPSTGKSYRAVLRLSEAGEAVAKQMEPMIESWVSAGGEGLTDEQREVFYQCLGMISENLKEKLEQ